MKRILKYGIILLSIITVCLFMVIINDYNKDELNFTLEEMKFMENNPHIKLASDPNFAPIIYVGEDGKLKGVVSDYVKVINDNTPLDIKVVDYNDWSDALLDIKEKKIDMIGSLIATENREDYIKFSDEYMNIPNIIITNSKRKDTEIGDLAFENVGVIRNSGNYELLIKNYPKAIPYPIENISQALRKLSMGEIKYFIGTSSQISYYIQKNNLSNIRVIKELDYSYSLHFGFREDYTILRDIVNKIIKAIPEEQKEEYSNRWIRFDIREQIFSLTLVKKIVFISTIIFVLLGLFIMVLKDQVGKKTDEVRGLNKELKKELVHKNKVIDEIALSMTNLIELHDTYTKGHSENVARISKLIAIECEMPPKEIKKVYLSALLHDLGKALIPKEIINKSGRLTSKEYAVIKGHPKLAYDILSSMEKFDDISNNILHHHERWDGGGYPMGVKGNEIPVISRIISIADTYDAMTTNRSYRNKFNHKVAFDEINKNSGTQFDPNLVEKFNVIYKRKF